MVHIASPRCVVETETRMYIHGTSVRERTDRAFKNFAREIFFDFPLPHSCPFPVSCFDATLHAWLRDGRRAATRVTAGRVWRAAIMYQAMELKVLVQCADNTSVKCGSVETIGRLILHLSLDVLSLLVSITARSCFFTSSHPTP